MRPLVALIAAVVILGSVYLYQQFVASIPFRDERIAEHQAEGVFSIEITLTFDPQPDEFTFEKIAAEVTFEGRDLLKETASIRAGEPIVISPVEGIAEATGDREGRNEIFVTVSGQAAASPDEFSLRDDSAAAQLARAIRVRVLRDEQPLADQTFWSEAGGAIQGRLVFTVEPLVQNESHDH